MSEAEQSRDRAKDPRRDAAAGAATDGDRGAVPAAREPARDTKDAQVSGGAQASGDTHGPERDVADAKPADAAGSASGAPDPRGREAAGDVKDPQDAQPERATGT
ncbi:serine/threonine protein kinase, partial [Streptomyces sp. NPDC059083]